MDAKLSLKRNMSWLVRTLYNAVTLAKIALKKSYLKTLFKNPSSEKWVHQKNMDSWFKPKTEHFCRKSAHLCQI